MKGITCFNIFAVYIKIFRICFKRESFTKKTDIKEPETGNNIPSLYKSLLTLQLFQDILLQSKEIHDIETIAK